MSRNGYLEKQKIAQAVREQAVRETYLQYALDTLCVVLNDPDVMGRDTFGAKRLQRVAAAWGKTYDVFYAALGRGPEADVVQEKLDVCLRKALGDECLPFEARYDWLEKQKYGR